MSKLSWIIFSAIVVLVLGGLIVYSQANRQSIDVADVDANSILVASEASGNIGDRVLGNAESDVVLYEYGDFQCPGCAAAAPNVKALMEEYGDRIALVYRNFPLTSIHPNARAAAAAAEAAGQQGKFWEMHDLLYENQTVWQAQDTNQRTSTFRSYADQLELDGEQFDTDFASTAINSKISFDQALGTKVGADSTPSFYFNGEPLSQEAASGLLQGNLDPMRALIDAEL